MAPPNHAASATVEKLPLMLLASLFYVVLMTVYDLLISASSHHQKAFAYHSASLVTLAEIGKFTVNFVANLVDRYMAKDACVICDTPRAGISLTTARAADGSLATTITDIAEDARWSNTPLPASGMLDSLKFEDWRGDGKPSVGDVLVSVNGEPVANMGAEATNAHRAAILNARKLHSAVRLQFCKPVTRINGVALKWLAIPAVLYACLNLLAFQSLLHVDLSTYGIFYNVNMLFTAVLWTLIFNKKFTSVQWATVAMLPIACAIVRIRPDQSGHLLSWSWGLMFVIAQALISSLASVANEFVYKHKELKGMSLPEQNMVLYTYGALSLMVFQLGAWLVTRSDQYDFRLFFVGFDERTVLIIVLMVSIGVTMSVILKKLSNIVKIFAIAFQTPSEVFCSHFVLGTPLTFTVALAVLLVVVSIVIFKFESEKQARSTVIEAEYTEIPSAPSALLSEPEYTYSDHGDLLFQI